MKSPAKFVWMVVASLATGTLAFAVEAFPVDTVHSTVIFRVKHQNASYAYGRFNDFTGKFLLDESDPSQSVFEVSVDAESIDTANTKRDLHLKGPDFFNSKQFPRITFKSKGATKSEGGFNVQGDLTLHGVTKPVAVVVMPVGTAKTQKGDTVAGIEAVFHIKRSDFGMNYMVGPIGDEVLLTVSLEGTRK